MRGRHKSSGPARAAHRLTLTTTEHARTRRKPATPTEGTPRLYTYGDMRTAPDGAFMLCTGACGGEFSATRGDYWMVPDEAQLECCGAPAVLARRESRIVLV